MGSHPMAGSEKSRAGIREDDLFEGRVTVVTPTDASRPQATRMRIEAFWRSLGAASCA